MTAEQASKHLGFNTVGAFRMCRSRYNRANPKRPIKGYRLLGGRSLRFKQTDLDRLVEAERKAVAL
jgi:hypothetical protein